VRCPLRLNDKWTEIVDCSVTASREAQNERLHVGPTARSGSAQRGQKFNGISVEGVGPRVKLNLHFAR
jgi:hypothetical protein